MAKVFVTDQTPGAMPSSEAKVLDALQSLNDEWRVFHSVKWQAVRGGRQGDGEADFVLLHPVRGLLILEVKGGGVSTRNGIWYSVDRFGAEHRIKNPFEQARDSKYALLNHLRDLKPSLSHIPVNYSVVFPDITVEDSIGLYGPREIICDSSNLRAIRECLDLVSGHWGIKSGLALNPGEISRLTTLLVPTLSVRVRLADRAAEVMDKLVVLTSQQIWAFSQLRVARRALVLGGAGTGKTILAIERARQLAANGFSTVLTCYNEPLSAYIREQLAASPEVTVLSFHALCLREISRSGAQVPRAPTLEWWDRTAPRLLADAIPITGTGFDAIIVDEAQDFGAEWLDALEVTLRTPDSPIYIFGDPHQQLYRRRWSKPADWPVITLDLNCRNTTQIARRVASLYDDPCTTLGASGPEPMFYEVDLKREGIDFLARFAERLLVEERLTPDQIVVLADDNGLVRSLRYASAGQEPFTSLGGHGIVVESIARFKGLEADVVVLVISDESMRDLDNFRSSLYVGASRARTALFVIGSAGLRRRLSWDGK